MSHTSSHRAANRLHQLHIYIPTLLSPSQRANPNLKGRATALLLHWIVPGCTKWATDLLFAHPTTDGNLAPLTPSSFQTNPLFLTVADRNDTHSLVVFEAAKYVRTTAAKPQLGRSIVSAAGPCVAFSLDASSPSGYSQFLSQ
ncbi:hypothetical protein CGRA01v4_09259 [Colletotrichum graminicola]|nr:hypothetical protein CGRA01v4_09259 [Colletotrichum graminicola]